MKEMQKIKRLIIPLIKGSPIIIGCFLAALFIARKTIQYSVPKYQSMAKIKLDDQKYGMSANNLYSDFDVFSTENKIVTEAEILKSPLLVGFTVDKLGLDVQVTRMGRLKNTILYKDNPFTFEYASDSASFKDIAYLMKVSGNSFAIYEHEKYVTNGTFGSPIELEGDQIIIDFNQEELNKKKIETNGVFQFNVKSRNSWISHINAELDVKAIDKDIPVLRVVMKTEDPDFSADFANALCEVYVNDYISTKSTAATKTLTFIDERMGELKQVLSESEDRLEGYRLDHNVINTTQETETGLREFSRLRVQLVNLEMEERSIRDLEEYISNGDYYEETAIQFGFGDLLMTELVKKLKLYTDEKKDLLVKYTENDPKVVNVQTKIDDIESYIKEAIVRNKETLLSKKEEIVAVLAEMEHQFDEIPTREKEMRALEREFHINEAVYTFLAEKKLEAQIASSALMSFHRIIQPAVPSREPVSPNKVLITFVCGFFGLFAGILIVFGSKVLGGKILTKGDVEKLTATQVTGVLTKIKRDENKRFAEFVTLATSLRGHDVVDKQTIVVTSSTKQEGKSYVSENLAYSYAKMGYSVALLDFNLFNPLYKLGHDYVIQDLLQQTANLKDVKAESEIVKRFGLVRANGNKFDSNATILMAHKNMDSVMRHITKAFDFVIIDTPGSVISIDALCMLKYADLCLYVIRAKKSKAQYVPNVDVIQEDYKIKETKIILNGAHVSTNYSGNFNGSQLHYAEVPKGLFRKVRYYLKIYSK